MSDLDGPDRGEAEVDPRRADSRRGVAPHRRKPRPGGRAPRGHRGRARLEWRAQGRGVYIVLWFGNVCGKQLPGHPDGLAHPETPQELREMLIAGLPESRRSQIDVFVMDLTRPVPS